MDLETRIKEAESRQFKAIFPNTVNHYDTLFGGAALAYMDEVAFITATRFSKQRLVTVSTNKIDFKRPIPAGTIIEIIGKIEHVGNTSIQVKVEIYVEEMYHEKREKAIEGLFTMVAVGEDKKPVRILKDFNS